MGKLVKVVRAEELEQASAQGWELVDRVPILHDVVAYVHMEEPVILQDRDGHTWSQAVGVKGEKVFRAASFLVEKSDESDLARAGERIRKLEDEARVSALDLEKLRVEAKLAEEEILRRRRSYDALAQDYESRGKLFDQAREAGRKMESDLARVRVAIGEFRMKEILAVEAPKK